MNVASDPAVVARRRRAIDAMGLGPLWVARAGRAPAAGSTDRPSADERAAAIAAMDWDTLRATVAGCVACSLCEGRTRTVFGNGDERPHWLVVGDAPDADADRVGEPFVGPTGRLLDAMLAAAGTSRRRGAFVVDALKCRPPRDREPTADEIAACRPYLERQVALLGPKVIVAVGGVAQRALFGDEAPGRGREHVLSIAGRDYPAIATHRPADLVERPEDKAAAWEDLVRAKAIVDRG